MMRLVRNVTLPVLVAVLTGCATGMTANGITTATDEAPDRILVTVKMDSSTGITGLSPSGRLDYLPPSAAQVRSRQQDRARTMAGEFPEEFSLRLEEDWPIPALGVYCFVFRLDEPGQREHIIMALARHPDVESVQPLNFFHAQSAPKRDSMSDPLMDVQHALTSGLVEVHRLATGSNVDVAVIDTGADLRHEDLVDANITAVDLVGDFALADPAVPAEYHGTAIVGIIAADHRNGKGISGYAPDANVLLLRACWQPQPLDERAVCNSFTLAKALSHALASNADIVNLSITGPRDPLLEQLAALLVERGTLLVAAGDSRKTFPASIPGSLVATDTLADANRGVMTLLPDDRYAIRSGTSLGAARISGIAALLRQIAPHITVAELQRRLGLLNTRSIHSAFAGLLTPSDSNATPSSSPASTAR